MNSTGIISKNGFVAWSSLHIMNYREKLNGNNFRCFRKIAHAVVNYYFLMYDEFPTDVIEKFEQDIEKLSQNPKADIIYSVQK